MGAKYPRSLNFQGELTRLPDQFPHLPASGKSFTGIQPMLQGVRVAVRST